MGARHSRILATGRQKGLASTIFQLDPDGNPIPILFVSRALKGAESNYFQGELDLLSVIHTLKKCSYLVAFHQVKIHMRPLPRELIKTTPSLSSRIAKWSLILLMYQIEFMGIHAPVTQLARYHQCLLHDESGEGLPRPSNSKQTITLLENVTMTSPNNSTNHFGVKLSPNLTEQFGHLRRLQETVPNITNLQKKFPAQFRI